MTHIACRLTAKNRDQLRNPTLGNRVWATGYLPFYTNKNPDRWSGVRPAPVCVLVVLQVLMAVLQSI